MTPELAFNTSVSFETNTNWQNYSGETGASYLIQVGGPRRPQLHLGRDRASPIAIALIRGLTRRSADDHRQLLGRPDARRSCTSCCRSRSSARSSSSGRASRRRCDGPRTRHDPRGRPADDRPRPDRVPGVDQGAGQQRRRLPQRQLGPSVREPQRRSPTGSRCSRSSSIPFALTYTFGRYAGNQRQGWTIFARDGRRPARRRRHRDEPTRPAATRCSRPASTRPRRQHGGQGDPLRRRRSAACSRRSRPARAPAPINAWHDSLQPIAGLVPAVQHGARRDHARAASAPACTGCSSSAPSWRCSSPA